MIAASSVCVRLGLWQLERRAEKQALHATQQAALAARPLDMADSLLATPAHGVRVRARGRWDRSAHVLLSGRTHLGAAGVSLVTPLVLANGERILVERGWLAAADSRTAHPEYDDTALVEITGVVQGFPRPGMATPWVALPADTHGVAIWSARALVADSARARLGAPLADWVLRVLPVSETDVHAHEVSSRAAPSEHSLRTVEASHEPAPPEPEPYVIADETMHLSYAIQWFAFAAVIAVGALALARRKG